MLDDETLLQPSLQQNTIDGELYWTAFAPAKLNLFLHITGRRDDGYHLLQTLFQFLEWSDVLHFQTRDDGLISLESPLEGVETEDNLIVRAANLLRSHVSSTLSEVAPGKSGCSIRLEKNLPMGGGLGGGSSDAATTLVVLNHLWALGLSQDELIELGGTLGADVPVFISGRSCWAEGTGDLMQSISLPEPWYVVVRPNAHVDTTSVFRDPQLTRNCSPIKIAHFLEGESSNVCEPVVSRNYPEVATTLDWFRGNAITFRSAIDNAGFDSLPAQKWLQSGPRMTGTGSCLFLPCQNEKEALQLESLLNADMPECVSLVKVMGASNISALFRA